MAAGRRPRGGSAPARYGRAAGDVATLGLAFASGVYLYTACCVVANEFYASGMAVVAEVAIPVAVVPGASGVPPFTVPWECRSAGCS